MVTGRLPFRAITPWEWSAKHVTTPPPPVGTLPTGGELSERRTAALMKALAKTPEERHPDVLSFAQDFTGVEELGAAWAQVVGGVPLPPSPSGRPPPPSQRRPPPPPPPRGGGQVPPPPPRSKAGPTSSGSDDAEDARTLLRQPKAAAPGPGPADQIPEVAADDVVPPYDIGTLSSVRQPKVSAVPSANPRSMASWPTMAGNPGQLPDDLLGLGPSPEGGQRSLAPDLSSPHRAGRRGGHQDLEFDELGALPGLSLDAVEPAPAETSPRGPRVEPESPPTAPRRAPASKRNQGTTRARGSRGAWWKFLLAGVLLLTVVGGYFGYRLVQFGQDLLLRVEEEMGKGEGRGHDVIEVGPQTTEDKITFHDAILEGSRVSLQDGKFEAALLGLETAKEIGKSDPKMLEEVRQEIAKAAPAQIRAMIRDGHCDEARAIYGRLEKVRAEGASGRGFGRKCPLQP
ncbi:MAG: hypothetical protein KC416_16280, partial [Myxococcales bacterium]|nr:hypothetical protein [Myxococcales bacterium]